MGKMFGTDGVRGVANKELTPNLAYEIGQAGTYVLSKSKGHSPRIIVGADTRISGDMLEAAITAGICSMGGNVYSAGIIPTPAIAYLIRKYGFDAGIMISASHNPFGDNGIKIFNSEGYKLPDSVEDEIESLIFDGLSALEKPTGEKVGTKVSLDTALDDYIDFLASVFEGKDLNGLKIALDCANGATFQAAPLIFQRLGAEVYVIHNEPNGTNINLKCGSTHMDSLMEFMHENRCDAGFAFDGDGDRCLVLDSDATKIDGDQIMSICGNYLKDRGKLKQDTIVATVMSNLGLFIMGEKQGINIEKTDVGDRYVLERMLQGGYSFGGEQSGHIIFLEHNTTGDGILTALQTAFIIKDTGKSLDRLNVLMEVLPQVLINAKVDNSKKNDYLSNPIIAAEIKELEERFAGNGRVLIRPSGTEPFVRVMIEGKDKEVLDSEAKRIAKIVEEQLK